MDGVQADEQAAESVWGLSAGEVQMMKALVTVIEIARVSEGTVGREPEGTEMEARDQADFSPTQRLCLSFFLPLVHALSPSVHCPPCFLHHHTQAHALSHCAHPLQEGIGRRSCAAESRSVALVEVSVGCASGC